LRTLAILTVLGLVFVPFLDVHAGFYKWVDGDGKEYYTNDPAQIPQQYRDGAAAVETRDDRVSIGNKPRPASGAVTSSTAVKEHKDKHGRGEEYWRKKAANHRLKLRDQQDEYNLVLKQLEVEDRNPKKLRHKKKESRSSLEKKMMKLEKDMAKTRRALDIDLPEEARRADAYPGWIRE